MRKPKPPTGAERQASYSARMREAGYKQIALWVTPEEEAKIRAMLAKGRAKPKAGR